ncbi:MAG: restriction endonuclease subunit S [Acetobacter sp.]|nr:restriction endonuclease subunit S [Acetobacter sp.]
MTTINDLTARLCPNGVEWKPLYELANYEQPSKYIVSNTNYDDAFSTPVLTAGKTFILGYTNDTDGVYLASKKHPVIIFDDFTCAFKWVDFPFKVKSSAIKIITANEEITLLRYIFHMMGKLAFIPNLSDHQRLWISKYSLFKIPLPPLEVQGKIVEVLDKFTALVEELVERKKQYRYYREVLLSFDEETPSVIRDMLSRLCPNGVEWKLLGEVAEIGTGSSNANEGLEEGLYPFYVRSQKPLRKNEYEFDETAIITAGDGNVGKVFHYVEGKYALHQRAYRIHITLPKVMPKYYFYYMCSAFPSYIEKLMYQSSVASIRRSMLTDFPVPLPPLEVQGKIVEILDQFHTLTTSLTEGIPAEIEARRKQYQYYRDKLLSFKEKKET